MTFAHFTEFIKALSIMDYVKFFAVVALVLVALWVYLEKHKIKAKEATSVAEIGLKGGKVKEASAIVQVGMLAAALAFLLKK